LRIRPAVDSLDIANRSKSSPLLDRGFLCLCMTISFIDGFKKTKTNELSTVFGRLIFP